jgi:tetratricopeptide (TPR) repeat protein
VPLLIDLKIVSILNIIFVVLLAFNMGVAYGELKKPQEAFDACKEAIKIKPDDHKAYYNMGVAYDKLKEYQEAIQNSHLGTFD